jgi:predicted nucleotidyltransferase
MLNNSLLFVNELGVRLAIGYGSSFTGKKRGLSREKDFDIVIVSDFFVSMSISKRQEIVIEKLGKKTDPVPLTTQEYIRLKKKKGSIVNIALMEGRILYLAK